MSDLPQRTVLVVDDEKNIRRTLQLVLEGEGYRVLGAETGGQGLAMLAGPDTPVDLAILDVKLPDMSGLDVLAKMRGDEGTKDLPIIVISGHATVHDAVSAIKLGASDFFEKPLARERVLVSVRNVLDAAKAHRELARVTEQQQQRFEMIGASAPMQKLFHEIEKVAPTKASVLVTGESGTGKELIARAIHFSSIRKDKKFVSINCGALPETLLESELFGHERGAFTGAVREKRGLFQEADGGTLLLDEISETTPTMQVKLLRAIQEKLIRRVGGNDEVSVDARIIAATNCDLTDLVSEGKFREDLYYRINVIPIALPPLRSRSEDIAPLTTHFIAAICKEQKIPEKKISLEAMRLLEAYPWPGNVRELENTLERTVALEAGPVINVSSLPEAIVLGVRTRVPDFESLPEEGINLEAYLETVGKRLMREALDRCGGVQTKAAELLHMSFRSFRYYAKKYNLVHREEMYEGDDEGPIEAKGTPA